MEEEQVVPLKEDNVIRIQYKCADCGAEDTGKYFRNELIAPNIICWKCRSGRIQQTPHGQEQHGRGMVIYNPGALPGSPVTIQ